MNSGTEVLRTRDPSADWSAADTARVRRDTFGCDSFVHLDNAGASPSPSPVQARLLDHLALEQDVGGYAAQSEAAADLEGFYASAASLISARPDEIAFAESATRAWDMAFYAIPFRAGDRILTSRSEYVSNYLSFLQVGRRYGVTIEVVPDGPDGSLDVGALANRLDDRVRAVSVCHVPTSNGVVNDVAAVGALLRGHPAFYIVDACQSIGQLPIDVGAIGCDILTVTGRKFLRGPRGTGFLYVAAKALDRLEPPFADLRAASWDRVDASRWVPGSRRFEAWEFSVAGKLGLGAAIDYALAIGLDRIEGRTRALADRLRDLLGGVDSITVLDRGARRAGIVTLASSRLPADALHAQLFAQGISTSVIDADQARLDPALADRPALLRLSPHYFNTEEELEATAAAVEKVIRACG